MSAKILFHVEEISRVQASRRILEDYQNLRHWAGWQVYFWSSWQGMQAKDVFAQVEWKKYQRAAVCTDISHNSSPCRQLYVWDGVSLNSVLESYVCIASLGWSYLHCFSIKFLIVCTQQYINKKKYKFVLFFSLMKIDPDPTAQRAEDTGFFLLCWSNDGNCARSKKRISFPSCHSFGKTISSSFGCELGSNPKGLRW